MPPCRVHSLARNSEAPALQPPKAPAPQSPRRLPHLAPSARLLSLNTVSSGRPSSLATSSTTAGLFSA